MFWFVIESAVVNAWVLYTKTMKAQQKPASMSQRLFQVAIANGLAKEWEDKGCTLFAHADKNISPTKKFSLGKRPVRVHLKSAQEDLRLIARFDSVDRHADYMAKIPEKENTRKRIKVDQNGRKIYPCHRTLACRYCADVLKMKNPSHTTFYCKKCGKPLCKGACFQKWNAALIANDRNPSYSV
jgi:hypothetical protein